LAFYAVVIIGRITSLARPSVSYGLPVLKRNGVGNPPKIAVLNVLHTGVTAVSIFRSRRQRSGLGSRDGVRVAQL